MLLYIVPVIIIGHHQNDKIPFIVGIIKGCPPQPAIRENNRNLFKKPGLLIRVEVFVQGIAHHRHAIDVQQDFPRLR